MESFVNYTQIMERDDRHIGYDFTLRELYESISSVKLNNNIPEVIHSQLNVAKNMAVYSYYLYSLSPEVGLKSFRIIELALKIRYPDMEKSGLKRLLTRAVKDGLLKDEGFSICDGASQDNKYSKSLIETIPGLRNSLSHGSPMLHPQCVRFLVTASELINQLFQKLETHDNKTSSNLSE